VYAHNSIDVAEWYQPMGLRGSPVAEGRWCVVSDHPRYRRMALVDGLLMYVVVGLLEFLKLKIVLQGAA
jgi:hypothetical protein